MAPLPGPASLGAHIPALKAFARPNGKAARARTLVSPETGVELPPEDADGTPSGPFELPFSEESQSQGSSETWAEAEARRHFRASALTVSLALLAAGAVFVSWWWNHRESTFPPGVLAEQESAFQLLQKDDAASRRRATEALSGLIAAHPTYLEARANFLVALLLELDDRKAAVRYQTNEMEELKAEVGRLQTLQNVPNWMEKVARNTDQLKALKTETDLLVGGVVAVEQQVSLAMGELPAANETRPLEMIPWLRAQALLTSVKGSGQALTLDQRYHLLNPQDPWDTVIFAEYALNARASPEILIQAMEEMARLEKSNASFIRPHVLSARLALMRKNRETAKLELEVVLALNPAHELAKQLLDWEKAAAEPK